MYILLFSGFFYICFSRGKLLIFKCYFVCERACGGCTFMCMCLSPYVQKCVYDSVCGYWSVCIYIYGVMHVTNT